MSDTPTKQGRRRSGRPRLADHRLSVAAGADLARRVETVAERCGVTVGVVLRASIEAGLPAATKRLKREAAAAAEADA